MQRNQAVPTWSIALIWVLTQGLGLWAADGNTSDSRQALPRKAVAAKAADFVFKLNLDNGHVGELFVGCKPGATDGYDRKLDDYAPPPGIGGVAYTFLVPADRKMNLYKDVRAPSTPEKPAQWLFFARIDKEPVTVSWDPKTLPVDANLYLMKWDGKSKEPGKVLNAAKVDKVKLEKTGYLRIWLGPKKDKKN